MASLDYLDRELLDFLCACAHHRVRVIRIKAPRLAALRRLRLARLVGFDDYAPSGSALADWTERQRTKSEGAPQLCAAEEPPAPAAVEPEGGGDARETAPPPKARRKRGASRTMAQRAERFDEARAQRDTQGASGTTRKVPGEESSGSSPRHAGERRDTVGAPINPSAGTGIPADPPASPNEPTVESAAVAEDPNEPRPALDDAAAVDLKVNARAGLRLRLSPEAHSARVVAGIKRAVRQKAQEALDAGTPAHKAGNVHVRSAMLDIERRRVEDARLADPLEQAKTVIRQGGWACFAAVIGGGPVGHFFIGNRVVTETELLAFAERLRTTRRRRA
jgi:hypothetical protein